MYHLPKLGVWRARNNGKKRKSLTPKIRNKSTDSRKHKQRNEQECGIKRKEDPNRFQYVFKKKKLASSQEKKRTMETKPETAQNDQKREKMGTRAQERETKPIRISK